jgi:hypothetical protein
MVGKSPGESRKWYYVDKYKPTLRLVIKASWETETKEN